MARMKCEWLRPTWTLLLAALLTTPAFTQQPTLPVKITNVEIGFPTLAERGSEGAGRVHKVGLWTPIHVTVVPDEQGQFRLPLLKDGTARARLILSVPDGEGDESSYHVDLVVGEKVPRTTTGYLKPGGQNPEFGVTVKYGLRSYSLPPFSSSFVNPAELNDHIYLSLGAKLPDLHEALVKLARNPDPKVRNTRPRHLAYETDPQRLPTHWFGYEAIDYLILTTDNDGFLGPLLRSPERIRAIADWVRQGGRLLIGVSWRNQEMTQQFLTSPIWDPALPKLLDAPRQTQVKTSSLVTAPGWIFPTEDFPASPRNPQPVASLQASPLTEVLMSLHSGEPFLTRISYGRGSIALTAFDLDRGTISTWKQRQEFWKSLVTSLAPIVQQGGEKEEEVQRWGRHQDAGNDLSTRLHRQLDEFDVPMISFGWVALFIFLYILVVGPLEYIILKRVFKRLELTWITFPVIVLSISVVAYFAAYAIKGNDLRVNKIDLVDLDLRTSLDASWKPAQARALGTTWFAILSPRLQNYTVGLEPLVDGWAEKAPEERPAPAVTLSWFGRPEPHGPGAFGRQRAPSLFRRAYDYAPAAQGMIGVPIPVWTTHAFQGTWELPLPELPFTVDLSYDPAQIDQVVRGTITNHLPFDLPEAYILAGDRYWTIEGGLKGRQHGSPPVSLTLKPDDQGARLVDEWGRDLRSHLDAGTNQIYDQRRKAQYNPLPHIKSFLFPDRLGGQYRNHMGRLLDQSWRLRTLNSNERHVRTAVLVAYAGRASGLSQQLTEEKNPLLATNLWLGALPETRDLHVGDSPEVQKQRPPLSGSVIQDTYIRVLLPVRPTQK